MKTTNTNNTIKAENEILEVPTFDVEFAMEEPKEVAKKTSKKEAPKAKAEKPAKKEEAKAPSKKTEKKVAPKAEAKKPEIKKVAKKTEEKPVAKAEKKTSKKEVAPKSETKPVAKKGKGKNKPLVFDSVTPAAQYLSDLLGLKITNSKDCIYKALRGNGKTHNFNVSKNEENKIVLEPIAC